MSEPVYPFVAAHPPEDTAAYFATIAASIELVANDEANVIEVWSDADAKVVDADGVEVPVGAIYLPSEGRASYDPASGTLYFSPQFGARDLLTKVLQDKKISATVFSHFTFSNLDTDDPAFGLPEIIRDAAALVAAEDQLKSPDDWATAFVTDGTSYFDLASPESSDPIPLRAPLFIGTGSVDPADSEQRRLVRVSAHDADGMALNPVTIFRLLTEAGALRVLDEDPDEKHPLWSLIRMLEFIDESKLMGSAYYEDRTKTIDTVVIHFSSAIALNQVDPFVVDEVIAIFERQPASAHYLLDRAGNIYRLVLEEKSAYHVKGDNTHTIGIELLGIGTWAEMDAMLSDLTYEEWEAAEASGFTGFTEAQYASLALLVDDIVIRNGLEKKYNSAPDSHPGGVTGHFAFNDPDKHDPGDYFDWTKIGLTKV